MTHRSLNAEINVTPFLDVLLVMIVTFLAALDARKTMDVSLPMPCSPTCTAKSAPIVLEVLADGSYLINREPVSGIALLAALHTIYDGRPDKELQVAGHRDVTYQNVLTAMDVARSAGVKVIAIPPGDLYSSK